MELRKRVRLSDGREAEEVFVLERGQDFSMIRQYRLIEGQHQGPERCRFGSHSRMEGLWHRIAGNLA